MSGAEDPIRNWIDRLKRNWLLAVIVGPMLAYGVVKGGGDAIAYLISRWAAEKTDRVFQKPSNVETGSIKPPSPQPDPYTKCLEDRHVEQAKSRKRIDAARADLLKCTTDYRMSAFWRQDKHADALDYCVEYNRIVIANEASAKSVETWTCRRPKK